MTKVTVHSFAFLFHLSTYSGTTNASIKPRNAKVFCRQTIPGNFLQRPGRWTLGKAITGMPTKTLSCFSCFGCFSHYTSLMIRATIPPTCSCMLISRYMQSSPMQYHS